MKKIVLASKNKCKLREFQEILKNYEILSLDEIDFNDDIEESGVTFFENALIKAKVVSKYLKDNNLNYDVIADDSGLCVNALKGEPGVYSSRYAGINCDSKNNRQLLLKNMKNITDRNAYFVCDIILYKIDGTYNFYEGKTYGSITHEERGNTTFGYDAIFHSNDLGITFGESDEKNKNRVSHRYRAIEKMIEDFE